MFTGTIGAYDFDPTTSTEKSGMTRSTKEYGAVAAEARVMRED
jgi:hypothetical protein